MMVVMDASVLISILISASGSKRKLLFSSKGDVIFPGRLLLEVGKHWKEIRDKSELSDEDLESSFSLIRKQVNVIPLDEYRSNLPGAKDVCPHMKDVEYFALALKLNCPIWSEDKLIREQHNAKVLNTRELLELPGLIDA